MLSDIIIMMISIDRSDIWQLLSKFLALRRGTGAQSRDWLMVVGSMQLQRFIR